MFQKFKRWLRGTFICSKCGREVYLMSFGFGETICPTCYRGEQPFVFFDEKYWLNRIITHYMKQGTMHKELDPIDLVMFDMASQTVESETL